MGNKKTIFVFATAVLLIYLLFPRVAGYVYRSNSDPIEIEEKKQEFYALGNFEEIDFNNLYDTEERRSELF